MQVCVLSLFRNSTSYVDRYAAQVAALRDALAADGHTLRVLAVEGDSTDDTFSQLGAALALHTLDRDVTQYHHGGPVFGSVDNPDRWTQVSKVFNHALARVQPADDAVIQVESDLYWEPSALLRLLGHLEQVDACAAMCFHRAGFFYDTWGHAGLDGVNFSAAPPYHASLAAADPLVEMQSAGSCIAMRGDVARSARFLPLHRANLGFCANMRMLGHRLWLDPTCRVEHP